MRKQLLAVLLCIALFLCASPPIHAADGNMDGDGGGMGSGESGINSWSPGYDGIRVTVVNKNTQQVSGTPFDWTKVTPASNSQSFTKRNKLQYLNGASLSPVFDAYGCVPAPSNMPSIVSSDGSSNIAAVKSFFTDETTVRAIADDANLSYDTLISGNFIIMLEPVAYFTYNGGNFAMTATEAALYDRMVGGGLKSKMGFLTHQNLPLSMYLERTELGIPPWSGGSGVISNENIIAYLGVGTVRFDDLEGEEPPPDDNSEAEYDFTYHAGTDVVTSVWIDNNGGNITPDHGATARFSIPGQSAVSKSYVMPAGESQLVWVKWTTPTDETDMTITVTASRGSPQKNTIRVKIVDLVEDTPPDPDGRDRNDNFSLKSPPSGENVTSLTWGEWYAWWQSKWVRVSGGEDERSYWEDQGEWKYGWNSYSASLQVEVDMMPDEKVPTATERYGVYTMKSAYGINVDITTTFRTTGGSGNTAPVQHVIAVFPEFDYQTYNRLLEPESHTAYEKNFWHFQNNEYSRYNNRVHFTPIWYPDDLKYPVAFTILDAWTPAGQLQTTVIADNIIIEGNVYDDWHIAPGYAPKD